MGKQPVLVTTQYRGVFFGYLESKEGNTVRISRARNCVYWSADCHGFIGLASTGPTSDCKVGPMAEELELFGVTSIAKVTEVAAKQWESEPWK